MAVNSKKKGNGWEREIANLFSENFNDTFKRVPQSGALVGGVNRKIVNDGLRSDAVEILAGDVITPKDFPFSLECKSYKDFEFHQVVSGCNKTLDKWIEQAQSDADVSKKQFLILMKFNRKGQYVCSYDLELANEKKLSNVLSNCLIYKGVFFIYTLDEFIKYSNEILVIRDWKTI